MPDLERSTTSGEDSREILAGLGYSEEKIDQLFADGVVGSSMI